METIVNNLYKWIKEDNFDHPPQLKNTNKIYKELQKVKEILLCFLVGQSGSIDNHTILKNICSYIRQIEALRLMMNPKHRIQKHIHDKTRIPYIIIRGYWWVNGKMVRDIHKIVSREDKYPKGINDKQVRIDGLNILQREMMDRYQKEFGETFEFSEVADLQYSV